MPSALGGKGAKAPQPVMGWREWVNLPELGLPRILAKIDTGARTSSLHAFDVEAFETDGVQHVRFGVHPVERDDSESVWCVARVADRRFVTDSGGHRQKRWVVETPVRLGEHEWAIEVTLADRTKMRHRMLLGRNAVKRRFLVDPGRRHLLDGAKRSQKKRPKATKPAPESESEPEPEAQKLERDV